MHSEFDLLSQLKSEASALLPPGTILKIDRGDGLFIADARHAAAGIDAIPGFTVRRKGSLNVIDPLPIHITGFEAAYDIPPGNLSLSVFRYRGTAPSGDIMTLFIEGLKLTYRHTVQDITTYDKKARQYIAAALRKKDTGGIYAVALLADLLMKGE